MIEKIEIKAPIEKEINPADVHKKSVIDPVKIYDRQPIAISGGFVNFPISFATYGNISLIKGEEKSRKSFFRSLLLACYIGGNANHHSELFKGHEQEGKYIIDIDTEQDKYYSWLNAKRVCDMVGTVPENYIYVNLREYTATEIRQYLAWLFLESEYRKKLGVVCIDGFVDCVDDFNNQIECREFTRDLMKYSTVTKSHITGVLHLNPGSDKGRGHLGTVLQQKCETVVVIKDEGNGISTAKCQRSRGIKVQDVAFEIRNWLPYEVEYKNALDAY